MSASLVGSEMCIRDSTALEEALPASAHAPVAIIDVDLRNASPSLERGAAVSYTHLTLPTICSV
eukprot:1767826-Alexandrium_andersonii.AAC.1